MLSKIINTLFLAFLMMLSGACSSDSFRIDTDFPDLGTQNVRIVYVQNNAINAQWLPVVDGKLSYIGVADDYVVVEIFNRHMEIITRVVARNGDKIKVSGKASEPYNLDVSGSDISEDWNEWLHNNAAIMEKGDRKGMEQSVEQYVATHKDDMLSALLVAYIYAHRDNVVKANELISTLDDSAVPDFAVRYINALSDDEPIFRYDRPLMSFRLYSSADSIETFIPANSKASLIYFWLSGGDSHKTIVKRLKSLSSNYSARNLKIADVAFESDSAVWKKIVKADSVKWSHFWGFGGRANPAVRNMGVKNVPYFIVSDSVGMAIYHGCSLDSACNAVSKKLDKKNKDKH